jgi:hypothetical protein
MHAVRVGGNMPRAVLEPADRIRHLRGAQHHKPGLSQFNFIYAYTKPHNLVTAPKGLLYRSIALAAM